MPEYVALEQQALMAPNSVDQDFGQSLQGCPSAVCGPAAVAPEMGWEGRSLI